MGRDRYRIKVSGRADPSLVSWLEAVIGLLRAVPKGWTVRVELEREDPPGGVGNS